MPAWLGASLLLALAGIGSAAADDTPPQWGVSPSLGFHQPTVRDLNQGAFRAPYEGTASITNELGGTDDLVMSYRTPLPAFNPGTLAGLDFQWRVDERNGFYMGFGTWEATSIANSIGTMPVQGVVSEISAQRKASLSYRGYHLGWRHIFSKQPKYNFYFLAGMHQIYDVDYRESFTMVFLSGPPQSFRKSVVVTGHGTGGFLLQGGGGGEYFLNDWLSIGMEGGYELSLKKVLLLNGTMDTDILDTDNLTINKPPVLPDSSNRLTYKSSAGGSYKNVALDFSGWTLLLKATLYY